MNHHVDNHLKSDNSKMSYINEIIQSNELESLFEDTFSKIENEEFHQKHAELLNAFQNFKTFVEAQSRIEKTQYLIELTDLEMKEINSNLKKLKEKFK